MSAEELDPTVAEAEQIDQHVADAIVTGWPGHIVLRYFLVAEVINPETGVRDMVTLSHDDCAPWDALGMLEVARIRARARMFDDDE